MRLSTVDPANAAMMRRVIRTRPLRDTEEAVQVLESRASRRGVVGLASFIRRVLARRQAREAGLAAPSGLPGREE